MSAINQSERVAALIQEIFAATRSLRVSLLADGPARARVLRASKQLTAALENPMDAAFEMALLVYAFTISLVPCYTNQADQYMKFLAVICIMRENCSRPRSLQYPHGCRCSQVCSGTRFHLWWRKATHRYASVRACCRLQRSTPPNPPCRH